MIQRQGVALTFYAHFVDTSGVSVTGLTVTVDVYEGVSGTPIVAAASATEQANGLYYYTLSSGSVDADGAYIAIFETASGSVAQKHLPAMQSVGNIVNSAVQSVAANAITAAAIATDAIDNDAIAANAVTEIQSGLATASALTTVAGYIDTEVAAIKAKTDALPADPADASDIATLIDAVPTAAEVWAYTTRTLTSSGSGGATADEVWAYSTRTLTSAGSSGATADEVWAYATRTLTSGGGATADEIADAVLSRGVSNVEDTADTTSLAALILATLESSAVGSSWVIRKTTGGTFVTKTLTLDDTAEAVVGVT